MVDFPNHGGQARVRPAAVTHDVIRKHPVSIAQRPDTRLDKVAMVIRSAAGIRAPQLHLLFQRFDRFLEVAHMILAGVVHGTSGSIGVGRFEVRGRQLGVMIRRQGAAAGSRAAARDANAFALAPIAIGCESAAPRTESERLLRF